MPPKADITALIEGDGFHCRFCGIPVVRAEADSSSLSRGVAVGIGNANQHAGFQALWVQYDHLLLHPRGGANEPSNMLVTCGPCNFGRNNLTLEEAGLADPQLRKPIQSPWDGLERFRKTPTV